MKKSQLTKKILFSPGIGIGFHTANPKFPEAHRDSHIIKLVEKGTEPKKIERYIKKKYGKEFDCRGVPQLFVYEVPFDEYYFIMEEYSGYEVIITQDLLLK